jgi:hypothetical protein
MAQPPYRALFVARLSNFFHRATPWQRDIWGIGSVLALEEVAEYADVLRSGAGLSDDGLKYAAASARREVVRDGGLGSEDVRSEIAALLERLSEDGKKKLQADDVLRLRHWAERCGDQYLARWGTVLGSNDPPGVELASRTVAAHLLDLGFSGNHLFSWLRAHEDADLPELLANAQEMAAAGDRTWTVLIPMLATPGKRMLSDRWLSAEDGIEWLLARGHTTSGLRINGAFCDDIVARDPWSAVERAHELVWRTKGRIDVAFTGPRSLVPADAAYVDGNDRTFLLQEPRRQVEIPNLRRPQVLYDARHYHEASALDDAIELVASMEAPNPGPAISGGWAATEALLFRPGEPGGAVLAADRMAAIVACSFGRAELMTLAFAAQEATGEFADRLRAIEDSYEKTRLMEAELRARTEISFSRATDTAALQRMVRLIDDPAGELERVREYASGTLRRLYNQRNLVMHAGSFRSCALRATMRTAPRLVGAGLDRIVRAFLDDHKPTEPLALAVRADTELSLCGRPGGRWISDLLE